MKELKFNPKNYVRLFEFKNYPLFYDSLWDELWERNEALFVNVNNLRTTYVPKKLFKNCLKKGKKFYGNVKDISKYRKEFNKIELDFNRICKNTITDLSLLPEFKEAAKLFLNYYSLTDFQYTDNAQEEIKVNFPDFGKYKDEKRISINKAFVGEKSYIKLFLEKYSREKDILFQDLLLYTIDELIDGKKIDVSERKNHVLYYEKGELRIVAGEEAQKIASKFRNIELLGKGMIANKGMVNGRAFVFHNDISNISQLSKLINEMNDRDIFITETTSPELILFCKKASAIVTNQGGIMSHAAIVSRELGIPCLVGVTNATHYFKTGDLVEVDANKGIVRILNRNSNK